MSTIILALIVLLGLITFISVPIVLILRIVRRRISAADARPPRGAASSPARPDSRSPYERIPTLLTAAERDFFVALQQATPAGHQVCAQVRLANLVQVKSWARRDKSHWWRIEAKCVDFVLVEMATFAPRLVVELDDSSHARAERRDRDAFVDTVLVEVGLPVLHVRWSRSYNPYELAERIAGRLGLATPARTVLAESPAYRGSSVNPEQRRRVSAPSMAAAPRIESVLATPAAITNSPAQACVTALAFDSDASAATHIACGQCYAALRPEAKFCSSCGATLVP
jgi:very-short-patch-repair endonuclease